MADGILSETTIDHDPFAQFARWFQDAAQEIANNAVMLATATKDGKPSARVVLLKEFDKDGFVFYTNYSGRKARELTENPRAAMVFFWPRLDRQVRIEGTISRVSKEQSEHYFHSRPRESQVGAWASAQSSIIPDRATLEKRVADVSSEYDGKEIPLPPHWGGFRLVPVDFEFWHQGSAGRLHDRLSYRKNPEGRWGIVRLSP